MSGKGGCDQPVCRISAPFLTDHALVAVLEALPGARIAGGAVRDALAGRAVPTGLAHGTVTAVAAHRGFEVTTLRRDVVTDGRHAIVEYTADWRADAARRDFTINAMTMTRAGEVFDYFGGIADLRAGLVRFVGDAATRIAEDYLRILRFFRFHARYGQGAPDAAAVAAIADAVPGLAQLSAERVWSELKRILAAPDPGATLALMERLGVLTAVLPEGVNVARCTALVARCAPADPVLRLAALLRGDAPALAERLRLSGGERDELVGLLAGAAVAPGADDDALRRALADTTRAIVIGRVWLHSGDAALIARLNAMKVPVFPLRGRDLAAAGVAAGAAMGALLRDLRAWWLEGGCRADAAACRAELARRVG